MKLPNTSRLMHCSLILFTAMVGAVLPQLASAQKVERSQNTYHVQACPGPAAPDTARCHAHVVTDSKGVPFENLNKNGKPILLDATPDRGGATPAVTPAGYGPPDLRSAYGLGSADVGQTTTTIAIVDAYGYTNALTDLNVYRKQFSIPAIPACTSSLKTGCFAKYNQNGQQSGYPRNNTGWAQETALDLQMASAMCPACKIILVQANSNSYSDLATAENTAAKLGARVISNSYGGSESSGTAVYDQAYNHSGVAITVSSGDSGYGVQFPASSEFVTAVGGTSLHKDQFGAWYETVWSGAGSGCSSVYAKPLWQTDRGCSKRTVADISAVADPATGVAVYAPSSSTSSSWMVFGGTSVAAPLIAGIYGVHGGILLTGAKSLYDYVTLGTQPPLHDVTSGNNGSCGSSYLCTGITGYDGPSGLGTPNGPAAFQ